mmetsp:Transcript_75304/g.147791  ORF Transcript_75304/g.147791 Transcript_75304/m.147791 type:complete len:299 (+) Transcript_75304:23-919(+)
MAESQNVSHHDATREKVGVTAHFVAGLRAREHNKSEGRLFSDPYAQCLVGNIFDKSARFMYPSSSTASHKDAAKYMEEDGRLKAVPQGLSDGVAVRTRKIDDEMMTYLSGVSQSQICVLGAGLDTRPWRVELPDASGQSNISYFEVDFPEIFEYKLPALSAAGAVSRFSYKAVNADLGVPGWTDKLLAAGFNPFLPTFWLLEGFTGYLTEEEFHSVFNVMTQISASGSRLVATFVTPTTKITTTMHRFTPDVPINEVTKHKGWRGKQHDIRDIGKEMGREWADASMDGYYIVLADYIK